MGLGKVIQYVSSILGFYPFRWVDNGTLLSIWIGILNAQDAKALGKFVEKLQDDDNNGPNSDLDQIEVTMKTRD